MTCLILGFGGQGRVVLDILRLRGEVRVAGFVDDACQGPGQEVYGQPVLGDSSFLSQALLEDITGIVVAIGNNAIRRARFEEALGLGFTPISAVHPSVVIAADARADAGLQAMAGVIVNPGAHIGRNVILNTAATVDHDCVVGDHAFIGPGSHLGGNVTVGDGAFLGIGVTVLPGLAIGQGAVVGAGAVVVRDIPPGVTVMGVPARVAGGASARG